MPGTRPDCGPGEVGRKPDQRLVASAPRRERLVASDERARQEASAPRRERLGRRQRLTRSSEFQEAYAQGRRWGGRYMTLWLRAGEGASLRLGVVTSRKVGGAVARNRARRLLREAYRRNRHRLSGEVDVILIARQPILKAKWEEIVGDLLELAKRAGLWSGAET